MKELKSNWFIVIIVALLLQSCNKYDAKNKLTKEYEELKKANWFIGDWENITNEMEMKEIWKQKNDSCFSAESFVTVKKDTVFYEKVDLLQRNDSLFYIVSVKEQNNEKPVSFYMTKATENELVFENPKHDYPNKITYKKMTSDSLVASISGLKDGKVSSETFPMKKHIQN